MSPPSSRSGAVGRSSHRHPEILGVDQHDSQRLATSPASMFVDAKAAAAAAAAGGAADSNNSNSNNSSNNNNNNNSNRMLSPSGGEGIGGGGPGPGGGSPPKTTTTTAANAGAAGTARKNQHAVIPASADGGYVSNNDDDDDRRRARQLQQLLQLQRQHHHPPEHPPFIITRPATTATSPPPTTTTGTTCTAAAPTGRQPQQQQQRRPPNAAAGDGDRRGRVATGGGGSTRGGGGIGGFAGDASSSGYGIRSRPVAGAVRRPGSDARTTSGSARRPRGGAGETGVGTDYYDVGGVTDALQRQVRDEADDAIPASGETDRFPELACTSIGNRSRAIQTQVSFSSLKETTQYVIDDLLEDSHFFGRNPRRILARFDTDEVECGGVLGTGEFGIVYQVDNILLKDGFVVKGDYAPVFGEASVCRGAATTAGRNAAAEKAAAAAAAAASKPQPVITDHNNDPNDNLRHKLEQRQLPPRAPEFPPRTIRVVAPTSSPTGSSHGNSGDNNTNANAGGGASTVLTTSGASSASFDGSTWPSVPTAEFESQPSPKPKHKLPDLDELQITAEHRNTSSAASIADGGASTVSRGSPMPGSPRAGACPSIGDGGGRHRHTASSVTFASRLGMGSCGEGGDVMDEIFSSEFDIDDDLFCSYHERHDNDETRMSQVQELRRRMALHVRSSVDGGTPRYALKRLKNNCMVQTDAAIDLACEARFLASIQHPNIIRLRGVVGEPGSPKFCLILDRLPATLIQRMDEWKAELRVVRGGFLGFGLLCRDTTVVSKIFADKLLAAYDIARGMRYLHSKKILFRDLKPENIGFDVHSEVRIFDFGLAKELKDRDLVQAPDGYQATGLTGSRRYMAPECVKCMPYGFSADVYSYSILLWQILALETPFAHYDAVKHFEMVVAKGKRPPRKSSVPAAWQDMLEDGWSADPQKRPTFGVICALLQEELHAIAGTSNVKDSIDNRSIFLTQRSLNSYQYGIE